MATNDTMAANPPHHAAPLPTDLKRKRSPSHDMHLAPAPLPKTPKHNHLQINYLARHNENDLPLITNDDTLPNILSLLSDYQGVLDRHESMACNLGARPLGPILIKRFERLFDGPPRVLKSHGKDGTTVSWLDVVEFARNKPEQFQLDQMSEGVRVCQFYTKQCRVQISEEDFVLISSGIPQKMIPPQPIIEDEEKELGTMEILEKNLSQICSLADQVAARTRQLNHRLKGRKQAILDRRATAVPAPPLARPTSPSNVALMNGSNSNASTPGHSQTHGPAHGQPSHPSPGSSGFVAVNARPHHESNGHGHSHTHSHSHGHGHGHSHSRGHGSSSSTRHELLSKFHTVNDRRMLSQSSSSSAEVRRPSVGSHTASHPSPPSAMPSRALQKPAEGPPGVQQPVPRPSHPLNESELHNMMNSPVPIPNTPSNLLPASSQRASQQPEKDDGGPFKVEMVQRMESLAKGERIVPPCDRCRRLHMDCLKNLTACMGCTKKHAKCSWKEVREGELRGGYTYPPGTTSNGQSETSDHEAGDRASTASPSIMQSPSHHGLTPSHTSHSNGQHTPQHQPSQHQTHEPSTLPSQQQDPPHDARPPPSRTTPPEREREQERNVEAQLNEAVHSGLAHANPRLPGSDGKSTDYPNQAMVA